ncbi:MAG: ribose transport system permease protein, partial [Alphaproteobacteria bacterium]|nr:ribose transport system permease protein [Alphaproteobacteria bacterium]
RFFGLRPEVGAYFVQHGREIGLPLAVLGLIVVFASFSDVFLSLANFRNVGLQAAALAAVSFGQTLVILTAGLDLSVGSIVALVSVVTALAILNFGIFAGVLIGLLTGVVAGLVNGFIVTKLRVFPFITTLAMLSFLSGLALNLSGGTPIIGLPSAFTDFAYQRFLGVPLPVILSLTLLAFTFFVLRYTRIGRNIYAIGGNQEAARLSGLRVDRVKTIAYMYSGVCSAIAAMILTTRVSSGQPTLGASLPLESVAAVVLGGVSLFGGRGSVVGVAFGVAFVSILSNGLNLLNVSSYTQMMVIGVALAGAVAIDQAFVRRGKVQ